MLIIKEMEIATRPAKTGFLMYVLKKTIKSPKAIFERFLAENILKRRKEARAKMTVLRKKKTLPLIKGSRELSAKITGVRAVRKRRSLVSLWKKPDKSRRSIAENMVSV